MNKKLVHITPFFCAIFVFILFFTSCSPKLYTTNGKVRERGKASYYGGKFHGRITASGEQFNQNAMTAAHRTLPFGTKVIVKNLNNGKQVTIKINDRGPSSKSRIIDLSKGAAKKIGMIQDGVVPVEIQYTKGTDINKKAKTRKRRK